MIRRVLPLCVALTIALPHARPARADDDRVQELERKVDVLTREIESLRLGGAAAETTVYAPRFGLGPAASKVYAQPSGVSIGGYGEMQFVKRDRENEGGAAVPGPRSALDFLRAVLYLGYKFNDELLLNSEIEVEHGGVLDVGAVEVDPGTGAGEAELSGEVTLEFGYLEWSRHRAFGVRAGKLLVPVGLTNESHEPPTYLGVQRPETERFVIPTTWSAMGAGVTGELTRGLAYRAYVIEGFDAAGLTAAEGIRGARQEASRSLVTHPGFTGRVDWTGTPGVLIGVSGYTGSTWQGEQPGGAALAPELRLWDVHGRLAWRGLQARALYAFGSLTQAPELSVALGVDGTAAALGEHLFGGYLEAGYDVLAALRPGSRWSALPYARYEEYDTQEGVVAPGSEDPAYAHRITTAGLALKPHPNVVIKADREWRHNEADSEISGWNASVGYLF
jgi:hypothetical protein